ncbi:acetylxylan esterase [Rubritalea spongiae]|uniref:Acetylxylan esterase n=1 Tax=Rubritalea spongiae TaxID=430797 RepID=A0ABW5E1C7_9BACT
MIFRAFLFFLVASSPLIADTASDLAALEALSNLTSAPTIYEVDDSSGVEESSATIATLSPGDHKTIFFDSIDYEGNPTRVYAWVNVPAGVSDVNKASAIVLVHGGGGRAFEDWVDRWSARGYVSISIDTEGNSNNSAGAKVHHALGGPPRTGVYNESSTAIEDQFMYHATAATILANSLLRSLPFVEDTKIGVHGVSWGGVITATAIGLDQRFAFAIPSYGCGHMYDAVGNWGDSLKNNEQYKSVWDPFLRLDRATMPIMWLSWPTDRPFNIDSQAQCAAKAPGTQMVTLIPGMGHGHGATWTRADSYDFADSIVNTGNAWCTQQSLSLVGDQITAEFASTRTLNSASLIYTNETGSTTPMTWPEVAVDSFAETSVGSGVWRVTATLPADATAWFLNVTATPTVTGYRDDTVFVSSGLQEVVEIQQPPLLQLGLKENGDTTTSGSVSIDFSAIYNLDVTSVDFVNESHAGAFSHILSFPYILLSGDTMDVYFDNSVAELAVGESATATMQITWLGLDNTANTLNIPLQATVDSPREIIYDVSANWSSKSPTVADHVIIRDGAIVTLDQDIEVSKLTVGKDSSQGELIIDQSYEILVSDDLSVFSGSTITVKDGNLDYLDPTLQLDGEIHITGGSFHLIGTQLTGDGKMLVTAGELIFDAAKSIDLAEIEISGGTLNFNGNGGTTQTYFGDNGVSTLTIIGSTPVISVGRLNLQPHTSTSPFIRFILDANGVSPVSSTSFMNLPQLSIVVDAADYTGGSADLVLLESSNFATLGNTANYSAPGFSAKGLDTYFQQSQATDDVILKLTKNAYGNWADSESLPSGNYDSNADPDGDGVVNLLEFVLGSDPQSSAPSNVPIAAISSDNLLFSFTRNTDANASTTQVFQYSANLYDWTDLPIDASDPNITINAAGAGLETVEIMISPSAPTEGKLFGKIMVELNQ